MIPGLTDDLLARLVSIGRRAAFDEFQEFLTDFPQVRSGQFMRQPFQEWYEIARRFSRDDVIALIRALTVAERDLPSFCCGSVSPVISLYRSLLDATDDDFGELRDWILAHTRNPYLPFGSMRYRPSSLSEYHRQTAEHEACRRAREKAEQEALAVRRTARQKQWDQQQKTRIHVRQSRAALIESLRSLPPIERLAHIVADMAHQVSFYPAEWSALDSDTVQSLPPQLRSAAIQRLAGRRSGPWKKLRKQLEGNA